MADETPPSPIADPLQRFMCVYKVPKKCYLCGAEWEGNAFAPQPAGAGRLPGMCEACGRKEDAELERLRRQSTPEGGLPAEGLKQPRRVTDVLDDELP